MQGLCRLFVKLVRSRAVSETPPLCLDTTETACAHEHPQARAGREDDHDRVPHSGTLMERVRPVLLLLLALLAPPNRVAAWIVTSQARYGARLDDLALATRGQSARNAYESLGWLWSAPMVPHEARGLGQSITYAIDPMLCDALLPRIAESFWGASLVNCVALRATIARAFATWGDNHPAISFRDVSALCDERDGGTPSAAGSTWCAHAEVWVTMHDASRTVREAAASGGYLVVDPPATEPAQADFASLAAIGVPRGRLTSSFAYTNGMEPALRVGALRLPKQVIEVYAASLEFPVDGVLLSPPPTATAAAPMAANATAMTFPASNATSPPTGNPAGGGTSGGDRRSAPPCYYLDDAFCAPFHRQKALTSADTSYSGGAALLFLLWSIVVVALAIELYRALGERAAPQATAVGHSSRPQQ